MNATISTEAGVLISGFDSRGRFPKSAAQHDAKEHELNSEPSLPMFNQLKSHRSQRQTFVCSFTTAVVLIISCHLTGSTARAANVLANASMESGLTAGWTCYGRTGQEGWYSYALATVPDPTVTGNNAFKVYAGWNGDPNYNGTYQDVACLATTVFTAGGWFRTKSTDKLIGTAESGNSAWIEVTFRDASNVVLGLYKRAVFDGSGVGDMWFEV